MINEIAALALLGALYLAAFAVAVFVFAVAVITLVFTACGAISAALWLFTLEWSCL